MIGDEGASGNAIELRCRDVTRTYADGRTTIRAIDGFSSRFRPGEMVAITGPSGSGKSTLLALLAAIDYADGGTIHAGETELGSLSTVEQAAFRAATVSYLSANNNLLSILTVYENISLALSLKRLAEFEIDRRIRESLNHLELVHLAHRRPATLSSGEAARAGLARAIAMDNPFVIADEPTAHLDESAAASIAALLAGLARNGRLVIVATHDPLVARHAHRTIRLRDGAAEAER